MRREADSSEVLESKPATSLVVERVAIRRRQRKVQKKGQSFPKVLTGKNVWLAMHESGDKNRCDLPILFIK